MSDRLDEIERLQALRDRGILSDQEFERAKGGLLGGPPKRKLPAWIVPTSGVLGMVLAIFVIKPLVGGSVSDPMAAPNQPVQSSPVGTWQISTKTDPMTDVTSTIAAKNFELPTAIIDVTISCSSTGQIVYQLASFDRERKPLEMRGGINDNMSPYVAYEVRVGEAAPTREVFSNPPYNNFISLETPDPEAMGIAAALGSARTTSDALSTAERVTFGLHLVHSDEALVLDQTAPSVASTLKPCVDLRSKQISEAEERARADENEQAARRSKALRSTSGNAM
ncbi:SHOCT domain-containing protein [Sphingomonas sp. JC676]|nr:SHOCT domain-containing protein [Sphingomonas sp. JC676]